VKEQEYQTMIEEITRFLNGGYQEVKKELTNRMTAAAEELDFERAKEYRDRIAHIEATMEKQKMTATDFTDRDVFGYAFDKGWMCVQVFFIRQGKLIERDVSMFPLYNEPEEEILSFLGQFYTKENHFKPKEILVPETISVELAGQLLGVKVLKPQRGQKKELVKLASKNATIALKEKFYLIERDEERTIKSVERLGEEMGIYTPHRIEAFDNSNIQGTNPVSAMVVFIDGKPEKREYRKYKIKTVTGPDDYESMREVVRRRYTRVLKEGLPLADLIIVDGGKGHIEAVRDVLENELGLEVPIAGLAKDEKHRTSQLLFGDPLKVIPLARNSQEFYLLQRIQDEVHRFAITFHRQLRGKSAFQSILDDIPGIGEKRRKMLLKHFGSVKKLKEATVEEIIANTKYGLFAKKMGGGSVNTSTGEFNFAVTEGYMIEDGKITHPVKGATLVGSGPEVIQKIDMIANNLSFGHGMCGSISGSIPTDVGQPTIRVSSMTVGGRGEKK